MKVKTLRFKDTKGFIHIMEDGSVATGYVPDVLPESASIDALKKYYDISGQKLPEEIDNKEVVEYDFIEAGEVSADIRNKLSPPLNLVSLLEDYFNDLTYELDKEKAKEFIVAEMKQTLVSVEYLSNLFSNAPKEEE